MKILPHSGAPTRCANPVHQPRCTMTKFICSTLLCLFATNASYAQAGLNAAVQTDGNPAIAGRLLFSGDFTNQNPAVKTITVCLCQQQGMVNTVVDQISTTWPNPVASGSLSTANSGLTSGNKYYTWVRIYDAQGQLIDQKTTQELTCP